MPLRRWTGSAFRAGATPRRWTGSAFRSGATLRRWTGTGWSPPLSAAMVIPATGDRVAFTGTTNTYVISGVDTYRDVNQLVVYRTGSVSPASRWGVEVQVSSTGKVIGFFNRQTTDTGATAIPSGGYVLSGHNLAANFLVNEAAVGDTVTVTRP